MATTIVTVLLVALGLATPSNAATLAGQVTGADGEPVVGAMATARQGDPIRDVTVYTDDRGRFRITDLDDEQAWKVRIRRIGWQDGTAEGTGSEAALRVALFDLMRSLDEPSDDPEG